MAGDRALRDWARFHNHGGLMLAVLMLIIFSAAQVECAICPSNILKGTDPGQSTATVNWSSQTNHTCDPDSGDSFQIRVTQVTCTSGDDNTMCTFTVTVQDQEQPTLECPVQISITTTRGQSTGQANWNTPQGSDNAGIDSTSRGCSENSGSLFAIGTSTVTCSVMDTAGNPASCTFHVTVRDNEDPVFNMNTCPGEPIRRTIPDFDPLQPTPTVVVTWDSPAASDNSGGSVTITSTHQPGEEFELGVTHVTYTATDPSGNTNNDCAFNVQVVVHPPGNHIFTESITSNNGDSCMTVVWPESEDEAVEEYALYYWKQGESKPDPTQRVVVRPQQGDTTFTYNKHRLCSLSPGELYTVEVGVEAGGVISTIDQWTKPLPPGQVSLVPGSLSSTSVEVTWDRVSLQNLEQYWVRISDGRDMGFVTKTTDRLMVDNLRPGIGINVYVYAVVGSGDARLQSDWKRTTITPAPPREDELLAYKYTESDIVVSWQANSNTKNARDPYMLYIEPEDADENYLTVFNPGNPASAKFEGLKPNTEYQVRLISNLGLTLSTSQKTRPERVANLRPTYVSDDAITLEWDGPTESYINSYQVYISPGEDTEPTEVSDTSCHFSSLTKRTEYYIKVVSVYDGMMSLPESLLVTAGVTKAEAGTPVNAVAIALGSVLGLLVVVLTSVIIVLCLKYRRLKNGKEGPATTEMGSFKANKAKLFVKGQHTASGCQESNDSEDLYERPSPSVHPKRVVSPTVPTYENEIIGKAPKPKKKIPIGVVPKARPRETKKPVYAIPDING